MDPLLRAAADKLTFDLSMAKYAVSISPKGAAKRATAEGGPTVAEALAERAARQEAQASAVQAYFDGDLPDGAPFEDEQTYERERKRLNGRPPLKEVFQALEQSRDRLIALYDGMSEAQAAHPWGEGEARASLLRAAHHLEVFGLDLLEAVPEVLDDPMLLNWALLADFGGEAEAARQRRLFERVRELFGDDDEDEGEENEDEDDDEDGE